MALASAVVPESRALELAPLASVAGAEDGLDAPLEEQPATSDAATAATQRTRHLENDPSMPIGNLEPLT
jgi:hypothetical protein